MRVLSLDSTFSLWPLQLKLNLGPKKVLSTSTSIIKETSVKLWTGHLELKTRLIMILYIMNCCFFICKTFLDLSVRYNANTRRTRTVSAGSEAIFWDRHPKQAPCCRIVPLKCVTDCFSCDIIVMVTYSHGRNTGAREQIGKTWNVHTFYKVLIFRSALLFKGWQSGKRERGIKSSWQHSYQWNDAHQSGFTYAAKWGERSVVWLFNSH